MSKAVAKNVDPFTVPEVVAFLNVKDKLEAFKEEYADIFAELEIIGEQYNAAREAADKVVRAQGISCGPFENYQTSTTYDADALFDSVGEERFLELGGRINTVRVYELDKVRIEAIILAGKLPAAVVKAVQKISPKYHVLPKVQIP